MLQTTSIITNIGAIALLYVAWCRLITFIVAILQTPLPEITTTIIVPAYKPIDAPYNPLSQLKEYGDKYREQYAALKEEHDDAEISAILTTLADEHIQQLTDECTEIKKKIADIRPFSSPSISEFQTENAGDTGIDIARKQLTAFIETDDIWRNIHAKYGTSSITQIEALLVKFEEIYYNKAYEMLGANDDDSDAEEQEPELGDIYQDQDTTELTENPPQPTLADKVAEFMANNVKYAYIQLYFYDLWLALISAQIADIRTGARNTDYIERAKEKYYRTKYQRLMHCILAEYTPLGNVYMYYNADNSSFEYYSDKTVPFPVLETVARRYVIIYRCKELYVDIANETVEMRKEDTIAYRKQHAFSGPKSMSEMNAYAAASDRQAASAAASQKILAKAPIRSWGESSSLLPNESAMQKYKRKVNNFIKKGNAIQMKFTQQIDRKVTNRRLKMSFADWQRERDAAKVAAKIIPGMSIPIEMRKFTGTNIDDSATF